MIAARGIERAPLASIGKQAGTSRGLPKHHFGSKDALVEKLASRAQDRVAAATLSELERVDRTCEDLSPLDLVITVATYLKLFEHPAAGARALIVMWAATFPTEASTEGMRDADRRSHDGWAELIATGSRKDRLEQM